MAAEAGAATRALHVASIALGAFLLFLVQPLIARMLLPYFGGGPAVWTTALVFFQTMLLLGYLYAHGVSRLQPPRLRPLLHLVLLALPLLLLPPRLAGAPDVAVGWPAATLTLLLASLVGAPFLVLAANSTLVQHWWAGAGLGGRRDPYWLYGASNLGSLLALPAYPLLLDRLLDVPAQAALWTAGYAGFAALTAAALLLARWGRWPAPAVTPAAVHVPPIGAARRTGWIARAGVGTSLLLALTQQLTTDVGSVPLLWVLPLGLYLMTWILAFARAGRLQREALAGSAALGIAVCLAMALLPVAFRLPAVAATTMFTLFFGALLCHHDLAADRPPAARLTEFYLCIALGGALGGIANGIVAPLVFDSVAEYPLALMALAVLLHADPTAPRGWRAAPYAPRTAFIVAGGVALLATAVYGRTATALAAAAATIAGAGLLVRRLPPLLAGLMLAAGAALLVDPRPGVIEQRRSFFGVLRVQLHEDELRLFHGTTLHGSQKRDPALRHVPGTYYHPATPMGRAVLAQPPGARIGVVGLGAGALAVLTRPDHTMVFHEIDPLVERLARRHFTYLDDAPGRVEVVIGDGRLNLGREPAAGYDLLVVDAFASDAIPTHLLTAEALDLYLTRVRPGGLVLLHISSRYADLRAVVRGYADARGVPFAMASHAPTAPERAEGASASLVAGLSADSAVIAALPEEAGWGRPAGPAATPVLWTDARTDLLRVLRWRLPAGS